MRFYLLVALSAVCMLAIGCEPATKTTAGGGSSTTQNDGQGFQEHDHPAHGPNHGHIFPIESPEYQGEWCKSSDNNVIKMHLLDKDMNPVAVKADSFLVIPTTGNDKTPFELEAESPDAEGKSSVFMLDDQALSVGIPLGVDIEIKFGETTLKGNIKAHEPLDH